MKHSFRKAVACLLASSCMLTSAFSALQVYAADQDENTTAELDEASTTAVTEKSATTAAEQAQEGTTAVPEETVPTAEESSETVKLTLLTEQS